jgi:hypothetical protein
LICFFFFSTGKQSNGSAKDVNVASKEAILTSSAKQGDVGGISGDASLSSPSSEGKSYSRRKCRNVLGTTPSRKFPRLASIRTSTDDSIPREADADVAKDLNDPVHKVAEDGKSSSTAFVVLPTVSQPLLSSEPTVNIAVAKVTAAEDGKTVTTAISISPTAVLVGNEGMASSLGKKATIFEGKSKFTAIPISPSASDKVTQTPAASENLCRSIVLSPRAKGMPESFGMPPRPWRMSPNVAANIGIPDFVSRSPGSVPSQMQKLVRELSDSVRKQGVLSRFGLESAGNVGSSTTKRKIADQGGSSSKKLRDNRMGMFTPPSFNLSS